MDLDSFVLAAATADLDDEPAAREHADAVEFRMDLAVDPRTALSEYEGDLPLICTNRVTSEGGEVADDEGRLEMLEIACRNDAVEAVDVELASIESGTAADVLATARDTGTSIVASVHEFEETPPPERLDDLLERAADVADVGKLAVTAHDPGDVLDLLAATWRRTTAGDRVATMAMGDAGRHSRAVAPLYGSRIGYAPVHSAEVTAPGQYDLAALRSLVDALQSGTDRSEAHDVSVNSR